MTSLTCVILCGGAGARLWPVSRELYPKQFLRLIGEQTLFQQTVARALRVSGGEKPIVICNETQRFIVAEQLRALGAEARIVLEPARRDSGPAIGAAAELVQRANGPGGLMLVLASDHLIEDVEAFARHVEEGACTASTGHIVTFGMVPDRPATEYGYIAPGEAIDASPARRVAAFVEKPDAAKAEAYIGQGYLWNSGMFLMRAGDLLDDLAAFEPEMSASVSGAVDTLMPHYDFERLGADAFLSSPSKSIDYAVMERTRRAAVLPATFAWSDVGNWSSLWDEEEHDGDGNAAIGQVELLESRNCYVRSDTLLTTVVGLDDVIVVATDDAILVAAKAHAQTVKDVVSRLKAQGRREVSEHRAIYRPWGWMQTIDRGQGFEVKRLIIEPGAKVSLQRHARRAEHWVVVSGTVKARIGDDRRKVSANESVYVPTGMLHRLENVGPEPAEVIEVRTGAYIDEDDVERVEDIYGRVEEAVD